MGLTPTLPIPFGQVDRSIPNSGTTWGQVLKDPPTSLGLDSTICRQVLQGLPAIPSGNENHQTWAKRIAWTGASG